ncbi:hypothetical protein SBOR_7914 [Sclerotinia borealis F-4128]|uniref:Apple domain-containing protein n=1 Tax=Sclerotinia borealis (strain F-4128) TaxID=1432307 RepID=W9CAV6_SCLBF|nr:hypothetical protein SBOR_7914 [Sclerotinia borealis F-4128]
MKLFNPATALYLLAGLQIAEVTATVNTYTNQFCFTRYTSENPATILTTTHINTIQSFTISTYNPSNIITATPPGIAITSISTSISVATSTEFQGPIQTLTSNIISTGTVFQTTTVIETTEIGPTETVTVAQSTVTVPTSPGFTPLASNPAVISGGGANKELKLHREINKQNNVHKTTNVGGETNIHKTTIININKPTRKPASINIPHKYPPRDSIPKDLVDPPQPRGQNDVHKTTNIGGETHVFKTTNINININVNTPTKRTTTKATSTKSRYYPHHYPPRDTTPELVDSSAAQVRDIDLETKSKRSWFDFWPSHDKIRYPYLVRCQEEVRVISTEVITLQPQEATTTTLPPQTSTSVVVSTTTHIVTSAPSTTTTIVQVENVTSTSTEKDIITHSTPATTTSFTPQATQYDMCQSNNLISAVGNAEVFTSYPRLPAVNTTIAWTYIGEPYPPPEDCCALCAQSSSCVGYSYDIDTRTDSLPGPQVSCSIWEDAVNVCNPASTRFNFCVSPTFPKWDFSRVVGNANCGQGELEIY